MEIIRHNKKRGTVSVAIAWIDRDGTTKVIVRGNSKSSLERDVYTHLAAGADPNGDVDGYCSCATMIVADLYLLAAGAVVETIRIRAQAQG